MTDFNIVVKVDTQEAARLIQQQTALLKGMDAATQKAVAASSQLTAASKREAQATQQRNDASRFMLRQLGAEAQEANKRNSASQRTIATLREEVNALGRLNAARLLGQAAYQKEAAAIAAENTARKMGINVLSKEGQEITALIRQKEELTRQEKALAAAARERALAERAASAGGGGAGQQDGASPSFYKNVGAAAQQAGYQVADFAVQVASGQNALLAFIQQGTQVAQFFGPWGAVLGAVGSIVGGVSLAFMNMRQAAQQAASGTKDFSESVQDIIEQLQSLKGLTTQSAENIDELGRAFLRADASQQKFAKGQIILEYFRSWSQGLKVAEEAADKAANVGREVLGLFSVRDQYLATPKELESRFRLPVGTMGKEVKELSEALANASIYKRTEDIIRLRAAISDLFTKGARSKEFREWGGAILEASNGIEDIAARSTKLNDLSSAINKGDDAVKGLVGTLATGKKAAEGFFTALDAKPLDKLREQIQQEQAAANILRTQGVKAYEDYRRAVEATTRAKEIAREQTESFAGTDEGAKAIRSQADAEAYYNTVLKNEATTLSTLTAQNEKYAESVGQTTQAIKSATDSARNALEESRLRLKYAQDESGELEVQLQLLRARQSLEDAGVKSGPVLKSIEADIRATEANNLTVARNQQIEAIKREIAEQRLLNSVIGSGTEAEKEAALQVKIAQALYEAKATATSAAGMAIASYVRELDALESQGEIDRVRATVDVINEQTAAINRAKEQYGESVAVIDKINELRSRGIDINSQYAQSELAVADAADKAAEDQEKAAKASDYLSAGFSRAMKQIDKSLDATVLTGDAITGVFNSWTNSLANFIVEFEFTMKSARQLFSDFGKAVIKEIANIGAKMAAAGILRFIGGTVFKSLGFASGGYVSGPGTGTSDSIPARLSNGEFVVNAKATAQYRPLLQAINSGDTRGIGGMSFAEGGEVGENDSLNDAFDRATESAFDNAMDSYGDAIASGVRDMARGDYGFGDAVGDILETITSVVSLGLVDLELTGRSLLDSITGNLETPGVSIDPLGGIAGLLGGPLGGAVLAGGRAGLGNTNYGKAQVASFTGGGVNAGYGFDLSTDVAEASDVLDNLTGALSGISDKFGGAALTGPSAGLTNAVEALNELAGEDSEFQGIADSINSLATSAPDLANALANSVIPQIQLVNAIAGKYRDSVTAMSPFLTVADELQLSVSKTFIDFGKGINELVAGLSGVERSGALQGVEQALRSMAEIDRFAPGLTEVQKKAQQATLEFQHLANVAGQFGISLSEVSNGLSRSLATLRGQYEGGFIREIESGTGRGYINTLNDAVSAIGTARADSAALGGGFDVAMRAINLRIQTAIAELNLPQLQQAAEEFASLAQTVPDAATVVGQLNNAISNLATSARATEFSRGIEDSILRIVDPTAAERVSIAREAETMRKDAADLGLSLNTINLYEQVRIAQLESESSQLQENLKVWEEWQNQLRRFRQSLLTDSTLSPLSPFARLQEAQRQFRETAAKAQAGDQQALEELESVSRAYLDASREYYASSEAYFQDFNEVQGVLQRTENYASAQISVAQQQLSAATTANGLLQQIKEQLAAGLTINGIADLLAGSSTGNRVPGGVSGGGGALTPGQQYLVNNPDVLAAATDPNSAFYQGAVAALGPGASLSQIAAYHYQIHGQNEGRQFAVGGLVTGAGSGTSDSIVASLSSGEYVMTASSVSRYGTAMLDAMNTGSLNFGVDVSALVAIGEKQANILSGIAYGVGQMLVELQGVRRAIIEGNDSMRRVLAR